MKVNAANIFFNIWHYKAFCSQIIKRNTKIYLDHSMCNFYKQLTDVIHIYLYHGINAGCCQVRIDIFWLRGLESGFPDYT